MYEIMFHEQIQRIKTKINKHKFGCIHYFQLDQKRNRLNKTKQKIKKMNLYEKKILSSTSSENNYIAAYTCRIKYLKYFNQHLSHQENAYVKACFG